MVPSAWRTRRLAQLVLGAFPTVLSAREACAMAAAPRVIDSHLHVWSSSHPYANGRNPPAELGDSVASVDALLASMRGCEPRIGGALVVQPINYEYDHAYVARALRDHPRVFRGMALADPTRGPERAADALRDAVATAPGLWTGVRFNPYLWPRDARDGAWLADDTGLALLSVCRELDLAIGVMAFGGLTETLAASVAALLDRDDAVPVVIDHWGFPRAEPGAAPAPGLAFDDASFGRLLSLAEAYPSRLYVKVSAHFRVAATAAPHADLKPKFDALLAACGADRLMWGSDFPYAASHGGQAASYDAVRRFAYNLPEAQRAAILGGTAARLFKF